MAVPGFPTAAVLLPCSNPSVGCDPSHGSTAAVPQGQLGASHQGEGEPWAGQGRAGQGGAGDAAELHPCELCLPDQPQGLLAPVIPLPRAGSCSLHWLLEHYLEQLPPSLA